MAVRSRLPGSSGVGLRALAVAALLGVPIVAVALPAGTSTGAPQSVVANSHPHQSGSVSSMPVVGMATTPDGHGYWLVASDGGIFSFGDATFYGSTGGMHLNQPIVGMAATPTGHGYWLVASDGGIFSFGDAAFSGSTGGMHLNRPIVGMASTADGHGYWLVASDGGIFSFGDATFYGSTGGMHLNQPIVGMAATPDGHGYWLVASDGGIFSFGDATFYGSTGGMHLNRPIVGMAATPDGHGYWLVASDGGIFTFGDAPFNGSMGGAPLNAPMVAIADHQSGGGYWTVASDGGLFSFGEAPYLGSLVNSVVSANVSGNPAANLPPNPNFLSACYPHNESATCTSEELSATDNARASEGLGPMVLPSNFGSLSPVQQLFVITDIERVDRGLPPFVGLVDTLDADAAVGADGNFDPLPTAMVAGTVATSWASNWAENGNPLGSNYYWMYDDGPGSGNIDCTAAGQPGCWGHRDNILSLTSSQRQYGGTLVMGAAEAYGTTGNGWASDTELLVLSSGPMPPLSYTWAAAVAAGAQ